MTLKITKPNSTARQRSRSMRSLIFQILLIIFLTAIIFTTGFKKSGSEFPTTDEEKISSLVESLTLEEKIGQMTLVEKNSIKPGDIRRKSIGAILSGGGGSPAFNTPENWHEMIMNYQAEALSSPSKIPLLYGIDAVHGNSNVQGAVIFPHQIGIGAARDKDLARKVAEITAAEMMATGANWNFSPGLNMPKELRWGRVYENFSSDHDLTAELGSAYVEGMASQKVLTAPKHFIGEGLEEWGSSKSYEVDQGDVIATEENLKSIYLKPFRSAIESGAMSIMVSRSSWNGKKISSNRNLLTAWLKQELGFKGFLVSDWGAIDQISDDGYENVISSINAGMDMVMVPTDYDKFMNNIIFAVKNGEIPMARIDDAVTRILRAKMSIGLLDENSPYDKSPDSIGTAEHRKVARQAVSESLVLLKNNGVLPIDRNKKKILIIGKGGDDVGMQSGGWTIDWQGVSGWNFLGTSIYKALSNEFPASRITYSENAFVRPAGRFDIGIAVVGEQPYAEGVGDKADLSLSALDMENITLARQNSKKVLVIILSGRPLILGAALDKADAVVAAWLPGSEGEGIADVLSGKNNFTGRLPFDWPKDMSQVRNISNYNNPLFSRGFGLGYRK